MDLSNSTAVTKLRRQEIEALVLGVPREVLAMAVTLLSGDARTIVAGLMQEPTLTPARVGEALKALSPDGQDAVATTIIQGAAGSALGDE